MIATGFDFEPLESGDVLIEFFGDDGVTINTQVITKECLSRMPVVAQALYLAVEQGKEVAIEYLNKMSILEQINERRINGYSI
jgi:hypothetical protein